MPQVIFESDTANNRLHPAPPAIPPVSVPPVPAPSAKTDSPAPKPLVDDGRRTFYAGASRALPQAGKVVITALVIVGLFGAWKIGSAVINGPDSPSQRFPAAPYPNGQIPAAQLHTIEGNYQLLPDAAVAFGELRQAFETAGHSLTINSAYRDTATQQKLVEKHGLLEDGGTAAPVGSSEHGLGIAVDLTLDFEALQWFRTHASAFGFTATIDAEPWHWVYTA